MFDLYLNVLEDSPTNEIISVPVESFVTLFIYKILDSPTTVNIYLIYDKDTESPSSGIKVNLKHLNYTLCNELESQANNCILPLLIKDDVMMIAGLCAVNRELIKHASESNKDFEAYLGFKGACLVAPTEASIWTQFCEIDYLKCVRNVISSSINSSETIEIMEEVARLESHLNQPVRMHNIYKLARQSAKKRREFITSGTPIQELDIEHKFVEGPYVCLADIIIYPCTELIWTSMPSVENFEELVPLTTKWLTMMRGAKDEKYKKVFKEFCHVCDDQKIERFVNYVSNNECQVSLYKSDPKRYKPANRIFTKQTDIDMYLEKINKIGVEFSSDNETSPGKCTPIDWDAIPRDALPEGGGLPEKRLETKKGQLFSLAREVVALAQPGDRIVDFCSGAGHLGILLAFLLPKCQITLLENKEESLTRAKKRVEAMELTNVLLYQCNLDYFRGDFEIGTSLHACGVATDIVLHLCLQKNAKFVCCPCCYGGVHNMPHISYPRSDRFRNGDVTESEYIHIAHCADQAHQKDSGSTNDQKKRQGQLCMDIIDTDRKLQAEELGYVVTLTKLEPVDCTPKNRLLVGYLRNDPLFKRHA